MKTTRQKCKEQCDKEIQKIILKDKLEKQMEQQLITLEAKIDTDDIPTCICEKSLEDKMEKGCLRCAQNLGGVAPGWGLLSGFGYVTWSQYISGIAAKAAADAGLKAGVKVGLVNAVKIVTKTLDGFGEVPTMDWAKLIAFGDFSDGVTLHAIFKNLNNMMNCHLDSGKYSQFSMFVQKFAKNFKPITANYSKEVAEVTKAVADAKTGVLTKAGNATSSLSTGITASIIAIVVIVLIMVHYINILLLALSLNILVINTHKKPSIRPRHIQTTRLLCECELYAPSNYDNDQEMKEVMQQFEDRTSQRFHEYDERMKTTRQKCKDRCNKEIEKIILKDKIEKELTETFATLQTDIQKEAIPTCICQKSLENKMEKNCLICGGVLGGGVMPGLGLIGGNSVYVLANYNTINVFIEKTIEALRDVSGMTNLFGDKISQFVTPAVFRKPMSLVETILSTKEKLCACPDMGNKILCSGMNPKLPEILPQKIQGAVNEGLSSVNNTWATATTPTTFFTNPIILSAIAILVIVIIMVIIYLILRYRRKKNLKKKLQYIKLLKE
ncbi:surface antigen [Plasmodium falciparum UGT5.1]|uniref:Surface antigen n=1 Tax=Plasmodium falciparum UGT5.1 TaxID=1237627 RepID=W7JEG3_PLAFA|nr:surface antigen [Plasmodium falciparum UGT5.1]